MSSVLQPTIGPDELVPKLAALALSPEGLTRTLAHWFLEHQADAASLSISETAARAGVSEASVFRFCRSLGLAGYRELRLALMESRGLARAARMLMPDLEAREGEDGFGAIARRIVEADIEAL